jgi:hypothetical protein
MGMSVGPDDAACPKFEGGHSGDAAALLEKPG